MLSRITFLFCLFASSLISAQPVIEGNPIICYPYSVEVYQVQSQEATSSYSWEIEGDAVPLNSTDDFFVLLEFQQAGTVTLTVTETDEDANELIATFIIAVEMSLPFIPFVGYTLCSESPLFINLSDNPFGINTFEWYALDNPEVFGETTSTQTSSFINDVLTNVTPSDQFVEYVVTPISTSGCRGVDIIVTHTINPQPVGFDFVLSTCTGADVSYDLQSHINFFGNSVPSTFFWSAFTDNPNVTGESLSTQDTDVINDILENISGHTQSVEYYVTPYSELTCPGSPFTINVDVSPSPWGSNEIQTICSGIRLDYNLQNNVNNLGNSVISSFSWTADYSVGLEGGIGNGSSSTITETLTNKTNITQSATYTVIPTSLDEGCEGSAFTIEFQIEPEPSISNDVTESVCSDVLVMFDLQTLVENDVASSFSVLNIASAPELQNNMSVSVGDIITELSGSFINSSNSSLSVTYSLEPQLMSLAGCSGNSFDIVFEVIPEIETIDFNGYACSGEAFEIDLISTVTNESVTNFNWTASYPDGITGGLGSSLGAVSTISETLLNFTDQDLIVSYSVKAIPEETCSSDPYTIEVTVNPEPIGVDFLADPICSNTPFEIDLSNSIINGVPTDLSWTASYPEGITGGMLSGSGNISELLINNTSSELNVTYTISPTNSASALLCIGDSFEVSATIIPSPIFNETTIIEQCSRDVLLINPQDLLATAIESSFEWTTEFPEGVSGEFTSGTGIIEDVIVNMSGIRQSVIYKITPTSSLSGCIGEDFTLELLINSEPLGVSAELEAFCSGDLSEVNPEEYINNTLESTFQWQAKYPDGISGGNSSGTGIIQETLTNSNKSQLIVEYEITPTSVAKGCIGETFILQAPVSPTPEFSLTNNSQQINSGEKIDLIVDSQVENISIELNNVEYIGEVSGMTETPATFNTFPALIDDMIINSELDSVSLTYFFDSKIDNCLGNPQSVTISIASPIITGLSQFKNLFDFRVNKELRQVEISGIERNAIVYVTSLTGQRVENRYVKNTNAVTIDLSGYSNQLFIITISGQIDYSFKIYL